jgi:tRNA-splicing endonuclease subunit Sen34
LDVKLPLLDLVGSGRLATGVKKGFLFAGTELYNPGSEHTSSQSTFCLEWAGI